MLGWLAIPVWGKIKLDFYLKQKSILGGGGRLKNLNVKKTNKTKKKTNEENNQKNGKTHTKNFKPFSRKGEYGGLTIKFTNLLQ